MGYNRDSHARNTRAIAALLARRMRPAAVAKRTGESVARVRLIDVVVRRVKDGYGTDSIAFVLGVSKGTVRRVRAALGIAATKADGGRMASRTSAPMVSAVASRCDQCGGLRGAVDHGPGDCARQRRADARREEQRMIERFDALAEFDAM